MLRSFCEETGVGMILISHLRRSQGDKVGGWSKDLYKC